MMKKEKKEKKKAKSKNLTKEEKQKKKQREKEDAIMQDKAEAMFIDRVLPIVDFDETTGVGIMEDGMLCDCFSIICKDLNSITQDELAMDILTWEKVYKTYPGDLKIVSFSFPADTKDQRDYVEYKINGTANPILKNIMGVKLNELQIVHDNFLTREAALFFFARSADEYKKNYTNLKSLLNSSLVPLVKIMEVEKKKKLYFKMCNKNMNH